MRSDALHPGGILGAVRRRRFSSSLALVAAALTGCAAFQAVDSEASWTTPPPDPIDSESAALAISLDIEERMIFGSNITPDVVLFVRLEDGENVQDLAGDRKRELIPSTVVRHQRHQTAYLLNAGPGEYVAVAALRRIDVAPTTAHWKGFDVQVDDGKSVDCCYFPREMIADSKTTVEPGSFAFMGHYAADLELGFDRADELQVHVKRLVKSMDRSTLDEGFFHDRDHRRMDLTAARTDREAEIEFGHMAQRDFKGTAWVGRIDALLSKP